MTLIARIIRHSCVFVSILLLSQAAEACRYTVRDVAMVDLAEQRYQVCVVSEGELPPAFVDSLSKATYVLADSNVRFRLLDITQEPANSAESAIVAALDTLEISSYPAAVLVAPDGRALHLPLPHDAGTTGENSINVDNLRKLLQSVITSPPREELLHFLLYGHSVILVVEGTDAANNRRAIAWGEAAITRVDRALPTMAKPIELPPRMIRFSLEEAQREKVLLWSLGVDLAQESVAQIALLFGQGRKLGPVLQIPGSRQQDLWRSLDVVGSDCECGLDRSWMEGPMIPHDWSTDDETKAVAALGFDPGNPLVKAEISRILARGPLNPKRSKKSIQEPLPPQMQLGEIDIDALISEESQFAESSQKKMPSDPTPDSTNGPIDDEPDLLAAHSEYENRPSTSRSKSSRTTALSQAQEDSPQEGSTAKSTLAWILAGLILVAGFGSLGVLLIGRKNQA